MPSTNTDSQPSAYANTHYNYTTLHPNPPLTQNNNHPCSPPLDQTPHQPPSLTITPT